MIVKFASALRNHLKKSLVAAGLTAYIGNYSLDKYQNELLRRKHCSSLASLGSQKLPKDNKLYRVTVFLNHHAYQRRLIDNFNKNVAPLLQISGLDVQMIYLDDDSEAKSYANVLDPTSTDAIVVAGDDNLLTKAITGMLRRPDFTSSRLWDIPVYVLPLGVWNNFATSFCFDYNLIEWCFQISKHILSGNKERHHVIEVKQLNETSSTTAVNPSEDKSKENKCVYVFTGLEWSCWRDVEYGGGGLSLVAMRPSTHKRRMVSIRDSWWLYPDQWWKRAGATIRHSWNWIRAPSLNKLPPLFSLTDNSRLIPSFFETNNPTSSSANNSVKIKPVRRPLAKQGRIVVTPVCAGCSKCWDDKSRLMTPPPAPIKPASYLGRFFGFTAYQTGTPPVPGKLSDEATEKQNLLLRRRKNSQCGQTRTLLLPRASRVVFALDEDRIRVNISPVATSLMGHIRQVFSHLTAPAYHLTTDYVASELPGSAAAAAAESGEPIGEHFDVSFLCSSVQFYPARIDGEFFWLDNDNFEACPVELKVLRNAVYTFPFSKVQASSPPVLVSSLTSS